MAGLVHVKPPVAHLFNVVVQVARQQTQIDQAVGQCAHRRVVEGVIRGPDFDRIDGALLGVEHHLVEGFLRAAESAIGREGPRDVGRVAVDLTTGVDQHQRVGVERVVVGDVVKHQRSLATGDNRLIRWHAAVFGVGVEQGRVQLGLAGRFGCARHGVLHRVSRDGSGALHPLDLVVGLDQALLVEQRLQRHHRGGSIQPDGVLHLHAQVIEVLLKTLVLAHQVVEVLSARHQLDEALVHLINGEHRIHTGLGACAVQAQARPVPAFFLRVAGAQEQGLFHRQAGGEHQHRLGLIDTGQVEKIAVLAIGVGGVAVSKLDRGGGDGHDGVIPDLGHQPLAALEVGFGVDLSRRHHRCQGPWGAHRRVVVRCFARWVCRCQRGRLAGDDRRATTAPPL